MSMSHDPMSYLFHGKTWYDQLVIDIEGNPEPYITLYMAMRPLFNSSQANALTVSHHTFTIHDSEMFTVWIMDLKFRPLAVQLWEGFIYRTLFPAIVL